MPIKKSETKTPVKSKTPVPKGEYYYAIGRRKTSVARVRLYKKGSGILEINGKPVSKFSQTVTLRRIIKKPLEQTGKLDEVDVTALVTGGGIKSQTESVSLGIARTLLLLNPDLRKSLKPLGLLKRDPRKKERKKPGLKRARRAPQWQKR